MYKTKLLAVFAIALCFILISCFVFPSEIIDWLRVDVGPSNRFGKEYIGAVYIFVFFVIVFCSILISSGNGNIFISSLLSIVTFITLIRVVSSFFSEFQENGLVDFRLMLGLFCLMAIMVINSLECINLYLNYNRRRDGN